MEKKNSEELGEETGDTDTERPEPSDTWEPEGGAVAATPNVLQMSAQKQVETLQQMSDMQLQQLPAGHLEHAFGEMQNLFPSLPEQERRPLQFLLQRIFQIMTQQSSDAGTINLAPKRSAQDGGDPSTQTPADTYSELQNLMATLQQEMQGVPLGDIILQVLADNPHLIVIQPHGGTYFNGTHIVLDPTMPHIDPVTVHETLHFLYARAGLTPNALLLWRDDDIEQTLNEETDAQVLGILYNRQWKSKVPGRRRMLHLEDLYQRAYNNAYLALAHTDLTSEERELAAHVAGWFAVRQGFADGTVTAAASGLPYPVDSAYEWYRLNKYPKPTQLPFNEPRPPRGIKATELRVPPPPPAVLVVTNGNQISRISLDTWHTYKGYSVPRLPQPQQLPPVEGHAEPTLTKGSKMDIQGVTTDESSRKWFQTV